MSLESNYDVIFAGGMLSLELLPSILLIPTFPVFQEALLLASQPVVLPKLLQR